MGQETQGRRDQIGDEASAGVDQLPRRKAGTQRSESRDRSTDLQTFCRGTWRASDRQATQQGTSSGHGTEGIAGPNNGMERYGGLSRSQEPSHPRNKERGTDYG